MSSCLLEFLCRQNISFCLVSVCCGKNIRQSNRGKQFKKCDESRGNPNDVTYSSCLLFALDLLQISKAINGNKQCYFPGVVVVIVLLTSRSSTNRNIQGGERIADGNSADEVEGTFPVEKLPARMLALKK